MTPLDYLLTALAAAAAYGGLVVGLGWPLWLILRRLDR